jgi:hypothetical protein
MDNTNDNLNFKVAAIIVTHQLLAAYDVLFDNVPTKFEQKLRKKREQKLTPYKRNLSMRYEIPTTNPILQPVLNHLRRDQNRAYIKKHMHLHA